MKRTFATLTPVLLLVMVSANGCRNDNAQSLYGSTTTDCSTVQAKFGADVKPIINAKCAISGCHDANAASNPAGLTFTSYTLLIPHIDQIEQRAVVQKTMPPTGPLTPAEIGKIKCWIDNGAQNN